MNIGKLIGKGATAEVFDYEKCKVIKLYNAGESFNSLKWEYDKMKDAYKNQVPCPEVFEIVELDGRVGYIMEKYCGMTIKEKMQWEIDKVNSNEMLIDLFESNFYEDIKGTARALYEVHKIKIPNWKNINHSFIWEVETTEYLSMEEKNV